MINFSLPHNLMRYIIISIASITCLLGCSSTKNATEISVDNEVKGRKMSNFQFLRQCMIGDFSSTMQAASDSDFFDIRLRMVPIWESNEEVFYLYVEQAVAASLNKPYRQRIYKVVKENDNAFTSYIYTVTQPLRLTGAMSDNTIFKQLTPDSLQLKDGCEVRLQFDTNSLSFVGSTGEKTCPSDRSGASWATSKVEINEDKMVSWDQGWNSEGKQVWGAVKGGYIFMKQ